MSAPDQHEGPCKDCGAPGPFPLEQCDYDHELYPDEEPVMCTCCPDCRWACYQDV